MSALMTASGTERGPAPLAGQGSAVVACEQGRFDASLGLKFRADDEGDVVIGVNVGAVTAISFGVGGRHPLDRGGCPSPKRPRRAIDVAPARTLLSA